MLYAVVTVDSDFVAMASQTGPAPRLFISSGAISLFRAIEELLRQNTIRIQRHFPQRRLETVKPIALGPHQTAKIQAHLLRSLSL